MRKAIAIGLLGLALAANQAVSQTAVEKGQILRDFDQSLIDYTQWHTCQSMFPVALSAATPAPKVFTPPVAMVFRQLIARAFAVAGGPVIRGVGGTHRAVVLQPFPTNEIHEFPRILVDSLPALPAPLEYRLVNNDLIIRDGGADVVIAVLRDALNTYTTRY